MALATSKTLYSVHIEKLPNNVDKMPASLCYEWSLYALIGLD